MIKSIELINFISHSNTEIVLADGVNVFVGPNGAGKSTIIDAITFALFGMHTRSKSKNLIKQGENSALVSLTFTLYDKEYVATRKIDTKGTLTATLDEIIGDKRESVAAGERKQFGESMSKEIEEMIGLDYKKLEIASIVSQGELNSIIDAKPKEFKELVNAIIGIDRLDAASQQMRGAVDEFNKKIRANTGYVHKDISRLENEYKSRSDELELSKSQIKKLRGEKSTITSESTQIESDINANIRKQDQMDILERRRLELERYIQQKRSEAQKEIHKLELYKRDLEKSRQQRLEEIRDQIRDLEKHKGDLERSRQQRLEEIRDQIRDLEKHKGDLERSRQQRLEEIRDQIRDLEKHKGDLEAIEIQRKQSLEEQIQSLKQRVRDLEISEERRISDLKKQIEEGEHKIHDCRDLLARTRDADRLESDMEKNDKEITYTRYKIQQHREEISSYKEQLDLANKLHLKEGKCPVCNSTVDKLNPLFDEQHIESEIEKTNQLIVQGEASQMQLDTRQREFVDQLQKVKSAQDILATYKITSMDDLATLQADIDAKTEQLDTVDTQAIDKVQADIDAKTEQLDTVDTQAIDKVQADIDAKTEQLDTVDTQAIDKVQADIDAKTEQLDTVDTQAIDKVQADIDAKTEQLDTVDTQAIDKVQADIDAKTEQLEESYADTIIEIDSHAAQMADDIKHLENETRGFSITKLEKLRQELESNRSRLTDIEGQIGATDQKVQSAEEWIITIQPVLGELGIVQEYVGLLDNISNRVYSRDGPVAQSLRSWALENISAKASEYLARLNTKISRVYLSEKAKNVSITCYMMGQTLDLASLSGGERVSVALALRLAMSSLLGSSRLNLMILDEPTTHLDAERKRSLVGVLNELANISSKDTTQFIIITHDAEIFEDSNVEQIYKFEFVGGTSVVNSPSLAQSSMDELYKSSHNYQQSQTYTRMYPQEVSDQNQIDQ